MDKLLWISMSGAKESFHSLAVRSNNLANASTLGFKADYENTLAMPEYAEAYPSRAFAMAERPGFNMEAGSIETTGRPLDIAIHGNSMLAVVDRQGNEAYTRYGSLMINDESILQTSNGLKVVGEDGGDIEIPAYASDLTISKDGVISGRPQGADANVVEVFGRLKLVTPEYQNIEKGYDGMFRNRDGSLMAQDENARVESGMVEASNVNPVEELTNLIKIQREYESQVKLMDHANQMDQQQNNLLSYN